jgi:5-methylcytosine-specific restriction endonuclease McrA
MPCSEKRASELLESGRARVHRLYPFAIRVVDLNFEEIAAANGIQPMRLSLDPGSKTTGLALSRVSESVDLETGEISAPVMHISFLMELIHRGAQIRKDLESRAVLRKGRRSRNLRYREPRFLNRKNKKKGWLAPSLQHRIDTTISWVNRLQKLAPITHLAQELVRFDMQKMQADEEGKTIEGVEYQRGTMAGFELGEYLLAKWNRTCAYCDAQNVPLEKEHIVPKSKGGSNRVSNLTLACRPCNQRKDNLDIKVFLAKDPIRLKRITAQAKAPLKDAAAVNSTRWALFGALKSTGLPVETGSGGQTKFNRVRLGIPKTHALDAACVGGVSDVRRPAQPTLVVKCNGRGSRSRTRNDAHGFPRGYLMKEKSIRGFRTGDMVRATVPASSKKAGVHFGRVAIRATGSFNIQTKNAAGEAVVIQGIGHKYCVLVARGDGYSYSLSTLSPFSTISNSLGLHGKFVTPVAVTRSASPCLKAGVSREIQR